MAENVPYLLLVEDNPTDEALTTRVLRRNNLAHRVEVVRDGAEALDFLLARGAHADRDATDLPRVVLLDLNLPKDSGLDVLRELRTHEATRVLPVVILTSSKEDVDIVEGYRDGANSYVVKPMEFTAFAEAITRVGLYWMLVDHGPVHRAAGVTGG